MKYRYRDQVIELPPAPPARWLANGLLEIALPARVVRVPVHVSGGTVSICWEGQTYLFSRELGGKPAEHRHHGGGTIIAPMPCLVTKVSVAQGDAVERGQDLITVEAMKTVQSLVAPFPGVVTKLEAREGELVAEGIVLAEVEEN